MNSRQNSSPIVAEGYSMTRLLIGLFLKSNGGKQKGSRLLWTILWDFRKKRRLNGALLGSMQGLGDRPRDSAGLRRRRRLEQHAVANDVDREVERTDRTKGLPEMKTAVARG